MSEENPSVESNNDRLMQQIQEEIEYFRSIGQEPKKLRVNQGLWEIFGPLGSERPETLFGIKITWIRGDKTVRWILE